MVELIELDRWLRPEAGSLESTILHYAHKSYRKGKRIVNANLTYHL
jgi:hypothetical protein